MRFAAVTSADTGWPPRNDELQRFGSRIPRERTRHVLACGPRCAGRFAPSIPCGRDQCPCARPDIRSTTRHPPPSACRPNHFLHNGTSRRLCLTATKASFELHSWRRREITAVAVRCIVQPTRSNIRDTMGLYSSFARSEINPHEELLQTQPGHRSSYNAQRRG